MILTSNVILFFFLMNRRPPRSPRTDTRCPYTPRFRAEAVGGTMSDLIAGRADLASCAGMVAVGGFSYGDVLGAGRGWATSILERTALRDMFETFFARGD